MNETNGKFLNNLAKYGGWIIAIASVGWMANGAISSKVDASDIKVLQAQINEAINTNGKQDTEIKNIYSSLERIEKMLSKSLGYEK